MVLLKITLNSIFFQENSQNLRKLRNAKYITIITNPENPIYKDSKRFTNITLTSACAHNKSIHVYDIYIIVYMN